MSPHRQSLKTVCMPPYENVENVSQTITSIIFDRASSHPAGWQLPGWPGNPTLIDKHNPHTPCSVLDPISAGTTSCSGPTGRESVPEICSPPQHLFRLFDQVSWCQWHRPAICLTRNMFCQITRVRVHQALLWIQFKCVLW